MFYAKCTYDLPLKDFALIYREETKVLFTLQLQTIRQTILFVLPIIQSLSKRKNICSSRFSNAPASPVKKYLAGCVSGSANDAVLSRFAEESFKLSTLTTKYSRWLTGSLYLGSTSGVLTGGKFDLPWG